MTEEDEINEIHKRVLVWSNTVNLQRRKDALRLIEMLRNWRIIAKNWRENYTEINEALKKAGRS